MTPHTESRDFVRPSAEELKNLISEIQNGFSDAGRSMYAKTALIRAFDKLIWQRINKKGVTEKNGESYECYNACVAEILKKIKDYDPGKSGSPSTYFTYVIDGTISTFKDELSNRGVASEHYSKVVTAVRDAVNRMALNGYDEPSMEMLSIETGYNLKQIETALSIIENAKTDIEYVEMPSSGNDSDPVWVSEHTAVKNAVHAALDGFEQVPLMAFLMYHGLIADCSEYVDQSILVRMCMQHGVSREELSKKMTNKQIGILLGGYSGKEVLAMAEKVREQLIQNPIFRSLQKEQI